MVDFVTHVLWNTYFNICGHKSETMWYMELKNGKSDKHLRHFKHTKFCQNLRGSLQFFGDWVWNDPLIF